MQVTAVGASTVVHLTLTNDVEPLKVILSIIPLAVAPRSEKVSPTERLVVEEHDS